jgi:hypothetical protein
MLDIIVKLARQSDLSDLGNIRIAAPVADDAGVPLDFASRYSKNAGTVITPRRARPALSQLGLRLHHRA